MTDRQGQPRTVPGGTVVSVPGRPQMTFATATSLYVLPVADVGLTAMGRDKTADLAAHRRVTLFPADGSSADARIDLWMPLVPPGDPARASLLIDLDASASVPPQWSPEAVAVAKPASLAWSYTSAAGPKRLSSDDLTDGTRGLRRSGVVRFRVPQDWTPDEGPDGRGLYRFSLSVRVARCSFDQPPRLLRIAPNAVVARHRRPVRPAPLTLDWLTLPGNAIVLAELDRDVLEPTPRVRLKESAGGWHRWQPTTDLALHGPADRVFFVDRELGALRFGDGINGRVPAVDRQATPNARLVYEAGGGAAGNISAAGQSGSAGEWSGAIAAAVAVTNPVGARGGAEAEPLTAARERIASARRQPTRAVTRADYETLAVTTPGVAVARAHAAIGHYPSQPCPVAGVVTVFVLPRVAREPDRPDAESRHVALPRVDPGALRAIRRRLEAARLVGTELYVRTAPYQDVSLQVNTSGDAAATEDLRVAIVNRLTRYLDPLEGGDTEDGWPFGGALRPSALLRQAQAAAGERASVESIAIRTGIVDEDCLDVPLGPHRLPALRGVAVVHRRAPRAQEGLR
jgi:predicted phage baseplate assembly protein